MANGGSDRFPIVRILVPAPFKLSFISSDSSADGSWFSVYESIGSVCYTTHQELDNLCKLFIRNVLSIKACSRCHI